VTSFQHSLGDKRKKGRGGGMNCPNNFFGRGGGFPKLKKRVQNCHILRKKLNLPLFLDRSRFMYVATIYLGLKKFLPFFVFLSNLANCSCG